MLTPLHWLAGIILGIMSKGQGRSIFWPSEYMENEIPISLMVSFAARPRFQLLVSKAGKKVNRPLGSYSRVPI